MARKIFGGIGKVLGIKKKKPAAATPAAPAEQKGPIIAQLGQPGGTSLGALLANRRRRSGPSNATILSDKLGG